MATGGGIAIGLLGLFLTIGGALSTLTVAAARRLFESALASDSADGLRQRGIDLVDRIRNPLLRRIINRRSGAFVGNALVEAIREDLSAKFRLAIVTAILGPALIVLALHVAGVVG